jgi:hypothetical protein
MPYALVFATTAREDLERLILSLPAARRAGALAAIEKLCAEFAAQPRFRPSPFSTPTLSLTFKVAGITYYWAATFQLSSDETTASITHVFRLTM